jgi:hypothetical protein
MAVRLSASRTGRFLLPRSVLISVSGSLFCYRLRKPQGLVRPGGLGEMMTLKYFMGSRALGLPVPVVLTELALRSLNFLKSFLFKREA